MPSSQLSERALRLICDAAITSRRAAYLRLDKGGALIETGGAIDHYPLPPLDAGSRPTEVIGFLNGVLPHDGRRGSLSAIHLADERWAEAHVVPGELEDWVILFDSSAENAAAQRLQQRLYDLRLAEERRRREGASAARTDDEQESIEADALEEIAVVHVIVQEADRIGRFRSPSQQLRFLAEVREMVAGVAERHDARVVRSQGASCALAVGLHRPDPDALHRGCSLAMELARGFDRPGEPGDLVRLSVALGAGPAAASFHRDRSSVRDVWGRCLDDADVLCRRARGGEVLAPLALAERLSSRCRGEAAGDSWRVLEPLSA